MIFTGAPFFAFAALFFPVYFSLSGRPRDYFVVAMSCFFYGWWNYRFLALLLATVCIGFCAGAGIHRAQSRGSKKLILFCSICLQLCILGFFKYLNFFAGSLAFLLSTLGLKNDWATINIVLPVGISFYTFHTMSYTIDIYRGKIAPEPRFIKFAEFVTTWPVLVAGPIIRASRLLPQLNRERRFKWVNLTAGSELIITGFFLKICVADNLSPVASLRFDAPEANNALSLLIGVLFFAFQIYGDFAGYSFIAIGLGRIMGIDFGRNFRRPYFSRNFSVFWERWHISLSSWLRDYLYISLGGNRRGTFRTYLNLMTTMLLGGLWHGANWTFVIWGFLHGSYLVVQRLLAKPLVDLCRRIRMPDRIIAISSGALVFLLVCLAWIFFRSPNVATAILIVCRIFTNGDYSFSGVLNQFLVAKGLGLIGLVATVEALMSLPQTSKLIMQWRLGRAAAAVIMIWLISLMGSFAGEQFIYFTF
jgi:D-alanyl-lipoteichoic acid acyltransferase DltB (MBOAT superfamily)